MAKKEFEQLDVFRQRVKEALKGKKCSQTQLMDILGSAGLVNGLMRGEAPAPSATTIYNLSKYLNVSADWLLGLSDFKTNDKATLEVCNTIGLSSETIDYLAQGTDKRQNKKSCHPVHNAINFLVDQSQHNYLNSLLPLFASFAALIKESDRSTIDAYFNLLPCGNSYSMQCRTTNGDEVTGTTSELSIPYIPGSEFFCDQFVSMREVMAESIINKISCIMRDMLKDARKNMDNVYTNLTVQRDKEESEV